MSGSSDEEFDILGRTTPRSLWSAQLSLSLNKHLQLLQEIAELRGLCLLDPKISRAVHLLARSLGRGYLQEKEHFLGGD